ncbi:MAG: 4'-phosphopantetheinyl transferase superfamily protein [Pseudomonadota bacterium]
MSTSKPHQFELSLIQALEASAPGSKAAWCQFSDHHWSDLTGEERQPLSRAVDKRRREFAAGRVAAKAGAAALGIELSSLPVGSQREPCWPGGLVGTITHDNVSALAWLAPQAQWLGLGLDVECSTRLKPNTWRLLFNDDELGVLNASDDPTLAVLMFSAKESIYKCLFPLVKRFVGYKEVSVLPGNREQLEVVLNDELAAETAISAMTVQAFHLDDRLATWTWLTREPSR